MNLFFNNPGNISPKNQETIGTRADLGYRISQTKEEQQKALYEAFDLVRKARRRGLETRVWANKTNLETLALLNRLTANEVGGQEKRNASILQKKMWELACWENQILNALRVYMNEISDFINQLKFLNPPLTVEHLRPFQEAMLADRRITVEAMEPLTKTVSHLTAYKLDLHHQDPHQTFDYKPAI